MKTYIVACMVDDLIDIASATCIQTKDRSCYFKCILAISLLNKDTLTFNYR